MSYVVLARKWRPMRFEDLVGQDHVARTLGNAIDAGRVAHAFLFTGVRGVGKTTSARILAKALNCMGKPGSRPEGAKDPGPTVTPCLECPACLEITEGTDLDVREIDGASHNGVEEVRKLQDSLPYRPSRDRFKIVIVDEVHMLTVSAWNAFLKTLEEPPPHVKFIFATTEAHKVPITILSRVQRFDFKMIPTRLIFDRLRWVLEQEGSKADDAAVSIIARQAAGSMRDAMSLLDQVIAFGGDELRGDEVAQVLGVASRAALVEIGQALVQGRAEECLRILGGLADQGFDIPHVTRDLLALLRDLVVARVCAAPGDLLDAADEEKAEIIAIAQSASEQDLLRLHHAFSAGFDAVVRGADPRSSLEMLLARLALRPALLPLDELLKRVGHLERRLGGGSSGGAGGGSAPRQGRSQGSPNPGRPSSPLATSQTEQRSADARASESHPTPEIEEVPEGPSFSAVPEDSPATFTAEIAREAVQRTDATASSRDSRVHPPLISQESGPSEEPPSPSVRADERILSDSKHAYGDGEAQRLEMMAKIGDRIRLSHDDWGAYFEQTVPLVADGKTLSLGLEKGHLFEKQLLSEEARKIFEQAVQDEWGKGAILEFVPRAENARPASTLAAERGRIRARAHDEAIAQVKSHPRIREALEIFNAQVKNVTLPTSPR